MAALVLALDFAVRHESLDLAALVVAVVELDFAVHHESLDLAVVVVAVELDFAVRHDLPDCCMTDMTYLTCLTYMTCMTYLTYMTEYRYCTQWNYAACNCCRAFWIVPSHPDPIRADLCHAFCRRKCKRSASLPQRRKLEIQR